MAIDTLLVYCGVFTRIPLTRCWRTMSSSRTSTPKPT